MVFKSRRNSATDIAELIAQENQEIAEDKLIALCDQLLLDGMNTAEIISGLLFTMHYVVSNEEENDTSLYYSYLLEQCKSQIQAVNDEYYEKK